MLYLLFFRISMPICVQDLFSINISHCLRYDTVSIYVTLISSLLLNYLPHQHFCETNVHDCSYDTSTMASLKPNSFFDGDIYEIL
jgi:hypothetical protein